MDFWHNKQRGEQNQIENRIKQIESIQGKKIQLVTWFGIEKWD